MIVILYVMDSLRPDFLSCYGHATPTSPNIDALGRDGIIFRNAFASSTWTRPSAASILTSLFPSVHGVSCLDDALPDSVPYLPEFLRKNGIRTAAISAIGQVSTDFGFGRGFDDFVELYKDQRIVEKREKISFEKSGWARRDFHASGDFVTLATSEDINEAIFPFLENTNEHDLFVFAWSMDTHDPYCHRDMGLARFNPSSTICFYREIKEARSEESISNYKSLYEDMIYYNDHHLGRLIERMKGLGLYDDALFILTADHGEAFGEHGFTGHAGPPFDEMIRVPLVIKFPGSKWRGEAADLVQHIDIFPTIVDCFGLREEGRPIQGKSLNGLAGDGRALRDFVFAENQPLKDELRYTSVRTATHKYIEMAAGTPRWGKVLRNIRQRLFWLVVKPRSLFSLRDDPLEQLNLFRRQKKLAACLRALMKRTMRENRKASTGAKNKKGQHEVDGRVAEQLRAMGYFD